MYLKKLRINIIVRFCLDFVTLFVIKLYVVTLCNIAPESKSSGCVWKTRIALFKFVNAFMYILRGKIVLKIV